MLKVIIIIGIVVLTIGIFLAYTFIFSVKCSKCGKKYDLFNVYSCDNCGTKNNRYVFTLIAQYYWILWIIAFITGIIIKIFKH